MTTSADIQNTIKSLRHHYESGITKPVTYRLTQLKALLRFLQEQEAEILKALYEDLGKPAAESLSTEVGVVISELKMTIKHLPSWMKPKRVGSPLMVMPASSQIYPEPLGVVLIIAPWNYPLQLTLAPLIGAMAAGNCVVIKPSEVAPATSRLLAKVLPTYLDPASVQIMEGSVAETTALLAETFDHILYTGNGKVARIVMTAAAKHLTPVTLELGGKSPCIIDEFTDFTTVAKRLVWAKFSNAGQTCVAPDYVLVKETHESALLQALQQALKNFYGEDAKASRDYGRIINANHFQRLMKLIPDSGDIVVGGTGDEAKRYIAPTILRNVPANAPVMEDEIFGPILPVISVKNMEEAISFINARPKPLSLYIFSHNKKLQEHIITSTSSGSVAVNYPMMQYINPLLPFGGIGASGMGCYHGKYTFDTFTHYKSVLKKPFWGDVSFIYPPYGKAFIKLVRWLMM